MKAFICDKCKNVFKGSVIRHTRIIPTRKSLDPNEMLQEFNLDLCGDCLHSWMFSNWNWLKEKCNNAKE